MVEEQQILFAPVPRAISSTMRTTLNLFFFLIIAIPVILLLPIPTDKNTSFAIMGCAIFIQIVYLYLFIINNQRLERKRLKSISFGASNLTSDESTEVLEIIDRTISETKGGLAKDQLPSIKALVDPLLQDEIQSIELHDELLEQELLQSSMPMKDKHFTLVIVFMTVILTYSAIKGSWLSAAFVIYIIVFLLPNISILRERLPFIRNEYRSLLVGLGWVSSHKRKQKWTIADSIILLRMKKNRPLGTLYVRLLGPTKDYDFMFESVRDPEFIRLWQRWMHPNPRLELMEQDSELSPSVKV
ncbi:MAG: hypothetical protein IH984_11610 [Planctomycetes bacterium]|nr:hypothetical protein [Planctomycetota bacterium]